MGLGWTKELSVGVDSIDKQHQIWFDKANALFDAGKNGKEKASVSELLRFLDEYTRLHFHDEETYMLSIKYPEYETQKTMHTAFIARLDKLKKEFKDSGENILIILNANKLVVEWLVQHIASQDKKIGVYARSLQK